MNAPFPTVLAVAVGGSVGALLRHGTEWVAAEAGTPGWIAILLVNIVGCAAMGFGFFWLESRLRRDGSSRLGHLHVRHHFRGTRGVLEEDPTIPAPELARSQRQLAVRSGLLLTGLLGGLTTFSSFGLDVVTLAETGQLAQAGLDIVLSLGLGVVGILVGLELGRRLLQPNRS
ncbi:MAG: CrcB family protein [Phycisphaerales bacterium]|nr:CrcB family protein [Phycisphaerales bacterium]